MTRFPRARLLSKAQLPKMHDEPLFLLCFLMTF